MPLVAETQVDGPLVGRTAARIYLDYQASTPVDPRVATLVYHFMVEGFGNASSREHVFGDEAAAAVEAACVRIANLIGARPERVTFTSGATESINLGLRGLVGAARARGVKRPLRVGRMPVEHIAVLGTCEALAASGEIELVDFAVDQHARLDLDDLEKKCRAGLDVVCVMAANNEVGTIYPIKDAAAVAHAHGALFFTDATQAVGKEAIAFDDWGIDLLAFSGHKLYGPKGVGALVTSAEVTLRPVIHGGSQQKGIRPGTLNVPGIAGLGEACRFRELEMEEDERRIRNQRNRLEAELQRSIPDIAVNGDLDNRLAGNLHVSLGGVPGRAVVAQLRDRVALSTGAACSSGIESPSHVLRAMELPSSRQEGAVRLGLGKFTTDADLEQVADLIASAVDRVRKLLST